MRSFDELISWLWPLLELAGAVVVVIKFWRSPLVAVLGGLGFGLQLAWGVTWRMLNFMRDRFDVPPAVYSLGQLASMFGAVLVIAAIALVPTRDPARP